MTNVPLRQTAGFSDASRLTLLPVRDDDEDAERTEARATGVAPKLRLVPTSSPQENAVLVAGGDPDRRAAVLADLNRTMPDGTTFRQAGAAWEVLAQASASCMVVLSSDLGDVPSESLMQVLSHRHPSLPVVSLEAPAPRDAVRPLD